MPKTSTPPPPAAPPPIWELEQQVLELTAKTLRARRKDLTPNTRLVQDLNLDSLEFVEYILDLEDAFHITVDQITSKRFFTREEMTLHDIAVMVLDRWGTGKPGRRLFRPALAPLPTAPFSTQLATPLTTADRAAPLFAPLDDRGPFPLFQRRTDGMRCVLLPPTPATIGSDEGTVDPDARPAHAVLLSAYLIDAEPVSTAAYARFLNDVGPVPDDVRMEWCGVQDFRRLFFQLEHVDGQWRSLAGTDQHPMVLVSWYGAAAYSLWANRYDWRAYRGDGAPPSDVTRPSPPTRPPPASCGGSLLPTEAQWEHAARVAGTREPWAARHTRGQTYTVATLPFLPVAVAPSAAGICHMPGNVWNWCRDAYHPDFYATPAARAADALDARPAGLRAERGGSWVGPARLATPAYRRGRVPTARGRCLGFRCVGLPADLPASPRH
jgi:acyl carrier protein